jgi:hypothetical protein
MTLRVMSGSAIIRDCVSNTRRPAAQCVGKKNQTCPRSSKLLWVIGPSRANRGQSHHPTSDIIVAIYLISLPPDRFPF